MLYIDGFLFSVVYQKKVKIKTKEQHFPEDLKWNWWSTPKMVSLVPPDNRQRFICTTLTDCFAACLLSPSFSFYFQQFSVWISKPIIYFSGFCVAWNLGVFFLFKFELNVKYTSTQFMFFLTKSSIALHVFVKISKMKNTDAQT